MKKSLLTALENVHQSLSSTLEVCNSTNKISVLKETLQKSSKVIASTLDEVSNSARIKSLSKTKKTLFAINNTLSGLSEGLASRELSLKDFRAVCSNLQSKFLPSFEESLEEISDKVSSTRTEEVAVEPSMAQETKGESLASQFITAGGSWKEDILRAKQQIDKSREVDAEQKALLDQEQDDVEDPDLDDDTRAYNKEESRLRGEEVVAARKLARIAAVGRTIPSSLRKAPYMMVRMPVLPLFENFSVVMEHNLKKLHIPYTILPGATYAILEEQILLMVSRKDLEVLNATAAKVPGKKKTAVRVSPEDYANSILKLLGTRSTTKYSLVSVESRTNPRNSDILCFWVMPTVQLNALIRQAGGSALVKEWGFPWDQERHKSTQVHTGKFTHPSSDPKNPEYLEFPQNAHKRPPGWKSKEAKSVGRIRTSTWE